MKELIPMDDMGVLVAKTSEKVLVDSRLVAEVFEKQHKNVLKDIERLTKTPGLGMEPGSESTESGLSAEFAKNNFIKTTYVDAQNQKRPCYLLTRDGFTVLAMGYTGKKAMKFKEAYIKRFNEMEDKLLQIQTLRDQYPALTDAIKDMHGDDTKPYHYSNEADMLNRIAIGCTAKQFREKNGIEKSEPIRPHLGSEEAELLDYLQRVDVGLVYSISDFQMRKQKLEWCAENWYKRKGYIPSRIKFKGVENKANGLPSYAVYEGTLLQNE